MIRVTLKTARSRRGGRGVQMRLLEIEEVGDEHGRESTSSWRTMNGEGSPAEKKKKVVVLTKSRRWREKADAVDLEAEARPVLIEGHHHHFMKKKIRFRSPTITDLRKRKSATP